MKYITIGLRWRAMPRGVIYQARAVYNESRCAADLYIKMDRNIIDKIVARPQEYLVRYCADEETPVIQALKYPMTRDEAVIVVDMPRSRWDALNNEV